MKSCLFAVLLLILASNQAWSGQYLPGTQPHPMALKSLDMGRTFDASTSGIINQHPRVPKPRVISKTEWGGGPSSGTMISQFPVSLTVHHEGSPKPLADDEDPKKLLRNLQAYGWAQKNWPDLPYHFIIDRGGNIYEGRDPMKAGDTNTAYDPRGKLLVMAMGNTEIQAPSQKQIDAMCDLMAWACDYYNIPPETVKGHMEYTPTDCPGKYLYPYVASGFFEGEIRERIKKAYGPAEKR
jgi:hypothetical protein